MAATGHHHEIEGLEGLLLPARKATGANPLPFYLMAGNRLLRDVPAETTVTADVIEAPKESLLWTLRREMEEIFELR